MMYPEKFRDGQPAPYGKPMFWQRLEDGTVIGPEDFDRQNEEAQRIVKDQLWDHRVVTVDDKPMCVDAPLLTEKEVNAVLSPLSRLFAAVREVLNVKDWDWHEGGVAPGYLHQMNELKSAYTALDLKDG